MPFVCACERSPGGPSSARRRGREPGVERAAGRCAAVRALRDDAAEERRLDRAHDDAVVGRVDEEVADVLVLLRGQLPERAAAADLDEEEQLPDAGAERADEAEDRRQLLHRLLHHDRVHLDDDSVAAQAGDRRQRLGVVAGDAADALVCRRLGAVEADRGDLHAAPAQVGNALVGQERRDAGRERDRNP